MKNFNFTKILQTYETKRSNIKSYISNDKPDRELNVIRQDIDRSFNFISIKNTSEREKLKRILYEVLATIPVDYIQSMSEVASIIVFHYFHQELEDENDEIEIDEDLLQQTKIVVTNILKEKVEPLILNDFEMYLRYNKIFLKVMEQRKKKISADESMKYMNDTLTWFCRSLSNIEDIFTVAGYILACPSNFYFVLLIKFFKEIDNKSKIKNLGKDVYEELLVIEKEFLEMENEVFNENKPVIKPRDMIIAGSVVALTVAILFGIFKKDK